MKVSTTLGEMDDSQLDKREFIDTTGQRIVEYYLGTDLVHRSVHTDLTPLDAAGAETASFG